jgi:glucans biosynthesis protein
MGIRVRKLACLVGVLGITALAFGAERRVIDFAYVQEQARRLAEDPFDPPDQDLPSELNNFNYDQYRDIRFRSEQALWKRDGLIWALELFHRGYLYRDKVKIFEFTDTHVQEIRFVSDWFTYGPLTGLEEDHWFPSHLDYAGVRLEYPLNQPTVWDEVAVFQGASYFRMLGPGQKYGLSARGIAVNTLKDEEFPIFRTFWLKRPDPEAENDRITLYALLDGPSVAGAYEFILTPEEERLRCEIRCTVYPRTEIEHLGLAAFSSMFYFGENSLQAPADYRPEVHDSDGLLIRDGEGGYHWRPLLNENGTHNTLLTTNGICAFGLLQRDRRFAAYEDLEADYEQRPSVWVEPLDGWPEGNIRLIEIQTEHEMADNIVAFWEPKDPPPAGEPFNFSYRIFWQLTDPSPRPRVVATRAGRSVNRLDEVSLVVDFEKPLVEELPEGTEPSVVLETPEGIELVHQSLVRNPSVDGWRLALQVRPRAGQEANDATVPGSFRAYLAHDGKPLTEIWTYPWTLPLDR